MQQAQDIVGPAGPKHLAYAQASKLKQIYYLIGRNTIDEWIWPSVLGISGEELNEDLVQYS